MVVYYDDPGNESDRKKAADIAQAIVENVAFAVPQGFKLETELLKSARALDPAVHEHLFEKMQHAITRRVLGETLTTFGGEDGKGTQALGNVHADTKEGRSVSLAKQLMAVINDQLVKPLVLWNYGPDAPMPTWTIEVKESEDLTRRLAVDSGLQKMGKKFTVGYVAERYQVPIATGVEGEDPEDVLEPISAGPALPMPSVPENTSPQFTEGSPEQQAKDEMKAFDAVFESLDKEARGILKQRAAEIARMAVPVVRQ